MIVWSLLRFRIRFPPVSLGGWLISFMFRMALLCGGVGFVHSMAVLFLRATSCLFFATFTWCPLGDLDRLVREPCLTFFRFDLETIQVIVTGTQAIPSIDFGRCFDLEEPFSQLPTTGPFEANRFNREVTPLFFFWLSSLKDGDSARRGRRSHQQPTTFRVSVLTSWMGQPATAMRA